MEGLHERLGPVGDGGLRRGTMGGGEAARGLCVIASQLSFQCVRRNTKRGRSDYEGRGKGKRTSVCSPLRRVRSSSAYFGMRAAPAPWAEAEASSSGPVDAPMARASLETGAVTRDMAVCDEMSGEGRRVDGWERGWEERGR